MFEPIEIPLILFVALVVFGFYGLISILIFIIYTGD